MRRGSANSGGNKDYLGTGRLSLTLGLRIQSPTGISPAVSTHI